jgi:pimeloyl-ACP methyl ester carboxylesterase
MRHERSNVIRRDVEVSSPVTSAESPDGRCAPGSFSEPAAQPGSSFGDICRPHATKIHNPSLFPARRRLKRALITARALGRIRRAGMSRGVLGLAALTAAGLFVAVFLGLSSSQTFHPGGPPIPKRALAATSMMQVLRDEHDLFEPSPPGQLTAELLAPEQWAPRPGSFEPLVPEPAEPDLTEPDQKADHPAAPITTVQVFLLLGGLVGTDGTVTSAGMFHLANMLRELPDTTVTTYNWNSWPEAYRAILANQGKAKIVVIGYSGGGSRATWLANMPSKPQIDLMVYYDPSPRWQMKPISANVKRALCYHNTNPMMWVPGIGTLGGGELVASAAAKAGDVLAGPAIETVDIAEQHFLVQVDQSLHQRTVDAVRSLVSPASVRAAPNLNAGQYRQVARDRTTALVRPSADRGRFSVAGL